MKDFTNLLFSKKSTISGKLLFHDLKVQMLSLTGIDQYFWFFSMKIFTIFTLFLGEICFLDVWGNMFPWCFYFSLWLIWLLVFENLFWRYSRGDGPSGLRRYTENRKDPGWNPTRPSAGLCVQPPYEALGDIGSNQE